ncbi:PepSY domain-containing protein [Dyella psychrodurans]|uniref:PepSY domain-containing protein n=1 Tax=Dyella psychrodurans TaxID=1927960 RepID=A0A370XEY5_9GAMM|nr:PepSY domain-containing protein [Dyella psychrodurans]RDS86781.1 PepSY domain-containing protein [Dyella psychrodurans]
MSASHQFLKLVRQIHLYVGVFIAPALLFFALTGGLQVFSLHETTRGSDYKPPAWLVTLAQVHKKQTAVVPVHKARPADADNHPAPPVVAAPNAAANPIAPMQVKPDGQHDDARHPILLKIFFAFVALGLFVSTLIGLYMAYRYSRKPGLITVILAAGVLLPIVLAFV